MPFTLDLRRSPRESLASVHHPPAWPAARGQSSVSSTMRHPGLPCLSWARGLAEPTFPGKLLPTTQGPSPWQAMLSSLEEGSIQGTKKGASARLFLSSSSPRWSHQSSRLLRHVPDWEDEMGQISCLCPGAISGCLSWICCGLWNQLW